MKGVSFSDKIEDALSSLVELGRRAVDGTVSPLFVDYENKKVLIRETTASASDSLIEFYKGGRITTGGVWTILSTANFFGSINATGALNSSGNANFLNVTAGLLTVTSTANLFGALNVTSSSLFLGNISATGIRAVGITSTAGVDFLSTRTGGLTSSANSDIFSLRMGGSTSTAGADLFNLRSGGITSTAETDFFSARIGTLRTTSTADFNSALNVTGSIVSNGTLNIKNNATASALTVLSIFSSAPVANTIYTDSLVKGWIRFNGALDTVDSSGNVSSETDVGVGQNTINWGTAFSNGSYCVVGASNHATRGNITIGSEAAGSVIVSTWDDAGNLVNSAKIGIIAVGAQ